MLDTLEVSPWGGFYLFLYDLGPGLPSLLHDEVEVKLEHLFHDWGHFSLSLVLGCSSGLFCLLELSRNLIFLSNLYIDSCLFEFHLVNLLGLQKSLVGLFKASLPDHTDGLLDVHDKLLWSSTCSDGDS